MVRYKQQIPMSVAPSQFPVSRMFDNVNSANTVFTQFVGQALFCFAEEIEAIRSRELIVRLLRVVSLPIEEI
jgi:hypothetical protein